MPDHSAADMNESAMIHFAHGDGFTAAAQLQLALLKDPTYHEAWANRAMVLTKLYDPFDAILNFDRAIALRPDLAEYYNNRGLCWAQMGYYANAVADYDRAIELRPAFAEALHNKATSLMWCKDIPGAVALYRKALSIKPLPDIHMSLANALLTNGELAEGWREYEWRMKAPQAYTRRMPLPEWRGERNRKMLVYAEQGLGDALHFGRYAPMIKQMFDCEVYVEVSRPLLRLFETMRGIDGVIVYGENVPLEIDCAIPMMSAPIYCGTDTIADIPWTGPYFDVKAGAVWKERVRAAPPGKLKVGICWASGVRTTQPELREVATRKSMLLSQLAPLANEGVSLFSLQKGVAAVRSGEAPFKIHDLTEHIHDFHDTAELIDCLDLVVTVDTSVAHLAGALGAEVYVMTPFVNCYRWLGTRSDSPWYPSLTQFTQPYPSDWTAIVNDICDTLRKRLSRAA